MRTVRRLRLRCLLLTTTPVVLSTLLLLTQSILCMAHQKHTFSRYYFTTIICTIALFQVRSDVCAFGGPFGHCPRVLNPFLSASYSNNSQYIFIRQVCQYVLVYLPSVCLWHRTVSNLPHLGHRYSHSLAWPAPATFLIQYLFRQWV